MQGHRRHKLTASEEGVKPLHACILQCFRQRVSNEHKIFISYPCLQKVKLMTKGSCLSSGCDTWRHIPRTASDSESAFTKTTFCKYFVSKISFADRQKRRPATTYLTCHFVRNFDLQSSNLQDSCKFLHDVFKLQRTWYVIRRSATIS